MDNVGSSDRAIRCAPPSTPNKRSLATVVSEVIPSNTGDARAQSNASPFSKRSLRRTQLNSFAWPDRHAADGGIPLKSIAGESLRLIDSRSEQVEPSRRTKLPTLDFLAQILPGRRNEIEQLLNLLGRPCDPVPPVFVYGPTASGKTSVVCEAMRVLRRPHAYVSCRSCHTSQLMYESILNQLVCHVRSATNNYSSARKCESLIDFAKHLPEACAQALSRKTALDKRLRSSTKQWVVAWVDAHSCCSFILEKTSMLRLSDVNAGRSLAFSVTSLSIYAEQSIPKAGVATPTEKANDTVYLIFDNVEQSRSWIGGTILLGALFHLSELSRLSNLGLIFISSVGLDGYQASSLAREPVSLYFREYSDFELHRILSLQRPNVGLYASFLSAALKTFSRACRRVTDLSHSLELLYPKYCEPVLCGAATTPDEVGKRQRFSMLQPHLRRALSQTLCINIYVPAARRNAVDQFGGSRGRLAISSRRFLPPGMDLQELGFEMPHCCKYLLLAAFIASRNTATKDDSLLDTGDGARGSIRKRRKSSSLGKGAEVYEQQDLGPGGFSLERLWAIFRCIVVDAGALALGFGQLYSSRHPNVVPEEMDGDGEETEEFSADVLMQLSTLVDLNLLSKGCTTSLDGNTRYRCNVDGNSMHKVAKSVRFPLSKYLLHG